MLERVRNFFNRTGKRVGQFVAETRSTLTQMELWSQILPQMFEASSLPSVSTASGQRLTLVYSCLNVIGETFGSLPCDVKQNSKNGSVTRYDNSVHRLVHDRPNPYMTAFDFWSTVAKLKHIHGNAYALIDRNQYFEPSAFYLIPPYEVQIRKSSSGEVYYQWKDKNLSYYDLLHFKNYSVDGLCGVSTITQNQLSVGLGLKLKTYNSSLIDNLPPGYLTGPKPKDEFEKGQIKGNWNKELGPKDGRSKADTIETARFGKIPYLYGGVEFKALTLPADQAAYIAGTELNDRDILGMFRMPPTMVSIYKDAPYNSSEQQDIAFVKYTLASIRNLEQELTEKCFPTTNQRRGKNLYCKFNLNGILRGDMQTRMKFYSGLFNIGAINANEIRAFEDLPGYGDNGEKYFVQGALIPVDQIAEFVRSKSAKQETQPTKTEDEIRSEIKAEFRELIQPKLNGHWKEVAPFFE